MVAWELLFTFFKIGAFSFGGGYTLAPLIEREFIIKRGWLSKGELIEIISISQMTPGVIAINTATFVGRKVGGLKGAIIASVGVILPSLFIISSIVSFLSGSFSNPIITKALIGIRTGAIAMIFYSVIDLFKTSINSIFGRVIFFLSLLSLIFSLLSPILLIVIGAFSGMILYQTNPKMINKFLQKEIS